MGLKDEFSESDLEDAVTSQIRQIVLELAAVLERPTDDLDRIQNEALSVGERLGLLGHIMDGSAFLIVPAVTA